MLSKAEILDAIRTGRSSKCLDGRDFDRLSDFFHPDDWGVLGLKLKDGVDPNTVTVKEWTRDAVIEQMRSDVDFGFEKALDRRGISSSFMHSTVKMWLWVLDDDELDDLGYAQYGLPLFKAVAVKYGFENQIGDDDGDEYKYSAEADWDD